MSNIVPPIGTEGIFTLTSPFTAPTTISYRVAAIRTFEDLINQGIDPQTLVYTPVALTDTELQADKAAKAVIITLLSNGGDPIHVPSTYISAYPNAGVVPHSWVVATISCGMLPDSYDTTLLKNAIATAVSQYTGITGTVYITTSPTIDAITEEQYLQNEAARQAAITNQTSDYADKLALQQRVVDLEQQVDDLIVIIEQLQS